MRIRTLVLFCFLTSFVFAQLPKGDRIVSYSIDFAQNNNYDSAFSYGTKACMEVVHLTFSWSAMEPVPTQIGGSAFNFLPIANIYYPVFGTKLEINIPVMNTVVKDVPSDLMATPFNSPVMISRFKTLIDSVLLKIPNVELAAICIGNESDAYMTTANEYAQFKNFLDSVSPYVKQKYFSMHGKVLKVGTTFTFGGLTGVTTNTLCKYVNQGRDIVAVTYYPQGANFQVRNPNVVPGDFAQLIAEYPDTLHSIYFVECGYQSSPSCGSSLLKQSQFIGYVFDAWDTYYKNVKYISFFKTTDWSQGRVDTLAVFYGLPNDTAFKEYLRTLGLRTFPGNGTNKPAYDNLLCQLAMRGFCNAYCSSLGLEGNEPSDMNIAIMPNPSRGQFTVKLEGLNLVTELNEITVYDVLGEKIYFTRSPQATIDLADKPGGIYFINVKHNGNSITKKIVIQK